MADQITSYSGTLPARTQTPANFSTNAESWVSWFTGTVVGEVNTLATSVEADAATASSAASTATTAKEQAEAAAALTSYQGAYNAGTTYSQGESVSYDNAFWVSAQNSNTGNTPAIGSSYWTIISLQQPSANASGAVTAGDPLSVKSDGTVMSAIGFGDIIGSETTVATAGINIASCFDPDTNQIIIAYRDNDDSGKGKAIVGSITGTTISFGSAYEFEAGALYNADNTIGCCYDTTNNKVVITYIDDDDTDKAKVIAGTISGTVITFETVATAHNAACTGCTCVFSATAGRVLMLTVSGGTGYQTVIDASTNPPTITASAAGYGTSGSVTVTSVSMAYDSTADRVEITYQDASPDLVIAQVSASSTSFGSVNTLSNRIGASSTAYDSSKNRTLRAFNQSDSSGENTTIELLLTKNNSDYPEVVDTQQIPMSNGVSYINVTAIGSGNFILMYSLTGDGDYLAIRVISIGEDRIKIGDEYIVNSTTSSYFSAAYDSNSDAVALNYYNNTDTVSTIINGDIETLNREIVGLATNSAADTESVKITPAGQVNASVTGLTTGAEYYIDEVTGSLTTEFTNRYAGIALSATKLLVKG